tara:strand:- start:1071 stop:1391 length:321 start_codon:yes stop_codon:yes gene_type:complete
MAKSVSTSISSSISTTDNTSGWTLQGGSSTLTLGSLGTTTIDSGSYIVQNGGGTYWNNDNEEIIDYLLFLSEALNLDIPDFNEFKDMSKEDRIIKLRDIKIDNILK